MAQDYVKRYVRGSVKVTMAFVIAIFLLGIAFALNNMLLLWFAFLGIFGVAFALLVAVVLIVGGGIRRRRLARTRGDKVALIAAPLALLLLLIASALPILWAANIGVMYARLMIEKPKYEAIIEHLRKDEHAPSQGYRKDLGIEYDVDYGPPIRVAFRPVGMLDNWSAIIFDPTGEMLKADGFDEEGNFAAPDGITKLFGGDLVSCRRLWGDYLHCAFT